MSKKNKISSLDVEFETRAYLRTLSDEELLKRARVKALKERNQMDVGQPVILLGTEEYAVIQERKQERERRKEKRTKVFRGFSHGVRSVVFTPLCSVMNIVGFLAEIVGKISSVGLLIAAYYIYQGVRVMMDGAALGEVEAFSKAVPFLILPFIAMAIARVCDAAYRWMKKQMY